MKILCFGSVNIDYVFRVAHFVQPGETVSSEGMTRNLGGKGANQAIAASLAGLDVYLAGNIGHDGDFLIPQLESYNLNLKYLNRDAEMTGNAMIQVSDSGQNSIILFKGGNHEITDAQIESVLSNFSGGDWLILQNEVNKLPEIIKAAKERGMSICFNPAPYTDDVRNYPLSFVDLMVVNEIEGADLSGLAYDEKPEMILKQLSSLYKDSDILLTLGSRGSMYCRRGMEETFFCPIVDAPVVDTTAAGDTFIGYFLAARSRGYSARKALEYASLASSITVSREGAAKSIPSAEEVFGK